MSCAEQAKSSTVGTSGSGRVTGASGGAGGTSVAVNAVSGSDTGRSFIVDERVFEEQFLRCQICHERFDQTDRSPKSLPCNHTFCMTCLIHIFDHAQPPSRRTVMWTDGALDGNLKCPTCRVEIFLSKSKIKELPSDHRVVQMIDFLSQAVVKSQNVCPKHDGQPLSFFCKKCLTPVCRDCTVLDHKESDSHTIVDVSEAINENSAQFNEIETQSRETLEKMKNRSDCLANASKRLDILERHLKSEIKETFIEYRLLLEKRQEALASMVHEMVKEQKAKINAKFVHVCEHGTQLQKLYDEFKASMKSSDVRKLFAVNQQMRENETQFIKIAAESDLDLFHSCEFEAQNEGSFLSDLSGLGEVRAKTDPELKRPISAHQLMVHDVEERRERDRLLESQSSNFRADDFFVGSDMIGMYRDLEPVAYHYENVDEDHHEDEDEDESPQNYWPDHAAVMSRIMSYYSQLGAGGDTPEAMEDRETVALSHRRSRRGRRGRDTNSVQVQSTLITDPEELNYFPAPHPVPDPAASSSATPTTAGYPRSDSRRRTPNALNANYRVVRHPTASSLRSQTTFRADDSS